MSTTPSPLEISWLTATRLSSLDLYRAAKQQHRKWRIFALACCRRAATISPNAHLESVIATAEDFADGTIGWEEMKTSRKHLTRVRKTLGPEFGANESVHSLINALTEATAKEPVTALGADRHCKYAFAAQTRPDFVKGLQDEDVRQLPLARDIFGNPFRPVTFAPAWQTAAATALAQSMYDRRDFAVMPVLADLLEEAGCDSADVLTHCRVEKQVHVRGCWVVDLVLGKS